MAKKKRAKRKATRESLPEELAEIQSVRMTHFQAENILRLKAVGLTWDESDQIVVEAANEQGKTSLIDSFAMLMSGGSLPAKPIRAGADKAKIVAEFDTEAGKLTVAKTFTEQKRPALKITLEGRRGSFASGQTILDVLFDHISLDPLEFANLESKAQAECLARLMGFDPTELDNKRKRLFDERTDANRDLKRLKAVYDEIPAVETDETETVSVSELMEELKRRQAHNSAGDELDDRHNDITAEIRRLKSDRKALEDKIAQIDADISEQNAELKIVRKQVAEFEVEDTAEIESQIGRVDEINNAVRAKEARDKARTEYLAAQEDADQLSIEIEQIDKRKAEALLKARENLPVKDLDITEDGVTYKGAPFAQAGNSATITVSAAIAMALNKDSAIKLLMIDDAEKMDANTTRKVTEMAREQGFQVFMARVLGLSGPSEGSVIIEDGTIKES